MRLTGFAATVIGSVFVVTACGGASGGQQSQAPATPAGNATAAATPADPPADATADRPNSPPAAAITVEALDTAFNVKTIEAPANATFKVTLNNTGELPHDIAFYDREGGAPLGESAVSPILQGGQTATISFTTPGPGTYFFVCLVHPREMTGTFVVH